MPPPQSRRDGSLSPELNTPPFLARRTHPDGATATVRGELGGGGDNLYDWVARAGLE